jgi:hypothetical protein
MNSGQAMGYLLAAHVQAVALILAAGWAGEWLNEHKKMGFDWNWVCYGFAVLAVAQTFFIVIRRVVIMDRENKKKKTDGRAP